MWPLPAANADLLAALGMNRIAAATLITRNRATVAQSRWLCERARGIRDRSVQLCPPPILGGSDSEEHEQDALDSPPNSDGLPRPRESDSETRRAVLVVSQDALMRAFIADAIRVRHEIVDAPDVTGAVAVATNGVRVDLVVAGCFTLGEPGALDTCRALARELYEYCPWLPVVLVTDTPPPTLTADLLLTGVRTFLRREFTSDELAATVTRVGRRPGAAVPTHTRVAAIKGTFAVLERALNNVPALATLAAMANMSRSHFSRTFHAVAGIPLRDYVRDLRLKRAQELMRSSRQSLTSIATTSGFYDLPHFNKAFRHRFGMSPTQFRLASLSSQSSPAA